MGMTATEFSAWINFGGGQTFWDELTAKFNIKSFLSGETGTQSGGWFNREINTLDDLKGLKIRMPGLGGEVVRRLGALPVVLPGGELYQSLQSGAIDATEWIGPWNDQAFGFHQVAKYFYAPGFHEPNAALSVGINLDVWNSLKPNHQEILRVACQAEATRTQTQYFYNNARALQSPVRDHNVEVRGFSPEIIAAVKKTSREVLEELASKNDLARRIHQSILEHMPMFENWSQYAEEGYMKLRRDG
jgi:TRAP-type mannitol/chloroaromatic compound transport system substrate-binding protein